jgi:hypothetical protein
MWCTDDGPEDGRIVPLTAVSVPAAEEEALAKYREWRAHGVEVADA